MLKVINVAVVLLASVATSVHADDRLAVFEFFARSGGAYCLAAAPSVIALQESMAGRALVLEYPYDNFNQGRVDRFWSAFSGSSPALPLVMVGSGFEVAQGPVSYSTRYRQMIDAELLRRPRAEIQAWSRRSDSALQVFATARNTGTTALLASRRPTFWAIVWEEGRIGLTNTFVRATASQTLTSDVNPGETVSVTLNVPAINPANWQQVRVAVLLEAQLAGSSRYDMLQAAVAQTADFTVTPAEITLSAAEPEAEVTFAGPPVLTVTAVADVPWLSVTPTTSAVPGKAIVRLVGSPQEGSAGNVRFSVSGSGMEFTATVKITALGTGEVWAALIPAAAHAPGGFGSVWRTDVAAVNPGTTTAIATLTFMPSVGVPVTRTATVMPGGTHEWGDVLVTLFGVDAEGSASGTILVGADQPLSVSSSTYNQGEAATFGGYLPALSRADAFTVGELAILPQLARTALFRTNVGLVNVGDAAAVVSVRLHDSNARPIGAAVGRTVPPNTLVQINDIFGVAGAGDRDLAYAIVEVSTSAAAVWAYASVVDNRTSDPTNVPLEIVRTASAGSFERMVPSVGHAPGAFGSLWRTDLAVVNPSGEEMAVEARLVPSDGSPALDRSFMIPTGTRRYDDVLVSLFGIDTNAVVTGALHLRSERPLVVSSRTYNVTEGGSYGAHLGGLAATTALTLARSGVIPQLKRGSWMRTNVAFANPGTETVTVAVRLHDSQGGTLGSEQLVTIAPGSLAQVNDVFAFCGTGDAAIAWARIEVRTEGGAVFAFASVVDNRTGDPTIVPAIGG